LRDKSGTNFAANLSPSHSRRYRIFLAVRIAPV
jgi:hypothetical protein